MTTTFSVNYTSLKIRKKMKILKSQNLIKIF